MEKNKKQIKTYWSKPSDFPPACFIRMMEDNACYNVLGYEDSTDRIILHGRKIKLSLLHFARWSDRPFDKFEDGMECTVEAVQAWKGSSDE